MNKSKARTNYPQRSRARVRDGAGAGQRASQLATIEAIAPKISCTAQSLHSWVTLAMRYAGVRAGLTTDEREFKDLARGNRLRLRDLKPAHLGYRARYEGVITGHIGWLVICGRAK
jgi:transposase